MRRRQIAFVLSSSVLGLLATSGFAYPLLGIAAFPWPLLIQPLYVLVLTYAMLRYRLMEVNHWAVRAVSWASLIGLAGLVSGASAGLAAQQAGLPFVGIAIALLAGLGLARPLRLLADRASCIQAERSRPRTWRNGGMRWRREGAKPRSTTLRARS
jgi:hypothetical protein